MGKVNNINIEELRQGLQEGSILLIDVREPAEYESESIEGSVNIPLSKLTMKDFKIQDFGNKKLVVHCLSGKRSELACEQLSNSGITELYNFTGGITAWKDSNLPLLHGARKILPLNQQTHLVLGLVVLMGTILGLLSSQWFFILPLIIGAGLINAGLTGWCGLAKLIAKAPWNK